MINIPSADLPELEVVFTEEEVWDMIKEMQLDQAPGPDGFIGAFFSKSLAGD
jgi:hypothetical protein